MNSLSSSPHLQDLEQLVTTLFAESKCACHVINPHKTRILMWKAKNPNFELSQKETKDNQVTYYLRIGIQKFVSQEQTDRNGETYWRYYACEPKKEEVIKEQALPTPELDPITKFNQRQTKAINHEGNNEQSNNEPAVNSQSS